MGEVWEVLVVVQGLGYAMTMDRKVAEGGDEVWQTKHGKGLVLVGVRSGRKRRGLVWMIADATPQGSDEIRWLQGCVAAHRARTGRLHNTSVQSSGLEVWRRRLEPSTGRRR